MSTLLIEIFLTLLLHGTLFQTAVVEHENAVTLTNGKSLTARENPRKRRQFSQTICDHYASCTNDTYNYYTCFCDRLCRIYDDCCPDYVDEEDGHQLTPLSPRSFVCMKFPVHSRQPVYVITECPATYSVQFVLDGCRLGPELADRSSAETFYAVPVSSRVTGLVYRNIYCAMCHGEEDVSFWNVTSEHCDKQQSPGPVTTEDTRQESGVGDMENESFVSGCLFSFSPMRDVPAP